MVKSALNPAVSSALSPRRLRARLLEPPQEARVAVFDLDGTVHQGLCYPLWRGLSIVDLIGLVWLRSLRSPRSWWSLLRRLQTYRATRRAPPVDEVSSADII